MAECECCERYVRDQDYYVHLKKCLTQIYCSECGKFFKRWQHIGHWFECFEKSYNSSESEDEAF